MNTATKMSMRTDLRRKRAHSLVAAVLKELRGHLDDYEVERAVAHAMERVFSQEGVEVLTDYDRAQIGLPPRSGDGWSMDEVIALERMRLEALCKPMAMTIPTWEAIQKQNQPPAPEGTGGEYV
jgi:hypothetical protein